MIGCLTDGCLTDVFHRGYNHQPGSFYHDKNHQLTRKPTKMLTICEAPALGVHKLG